MRCQDTLFRYRLVDHQVYVQNRETKDRLSLNGLTFNDGSNQCEWKRCFSAPDAEPFTEENEDISALKAFAASLDGYMADLYEWLLVYFAGGKEKLSLKEIADRWGVSRAKAYRDKDDMIQTIREAIESARE